MNGPVEQAASRPKAGATALLHRRLAKRRPDAYPLPTCKDKSAFSLAN